MEVERILVVDADQVFRSDVLDVFSTSLKGRVYGYPPFCSSRPEVQHLRFWEGGYWRRHLGERGTYHISALFLVDLKNFRKKGTGPLLRDVYEHLSADPNSLANLDQDLPNYTQHLVPIHSLPMDTLWCETWCSDAAKLSARAIDLCANPMKGEGKVQQAKRIIPEWTTYDQICRGLIESEDKMEDSAD
eukprot:GHVT01045261.1.p1 GENE.GHVT01045261.1~~GHVT01045261.1.p1  ORF type:complete len:189 (+),score=25.83 GHVT01045261.1:338-904(+)